MIVISNTSPIISLSTVGKLHLIQQQYKEIIIPNSVFDEITSGAGRPGSTELASAQWIKSLPVQNNQKVVDLVRNENLDPGEAAVIALGLELQAQRLILDEKRARKVASKLGFDHVGVLGILVKAKHDGTLSSIRPVLNELINQAGYRLGKELYDKVLKTVGE